MGRAESHPKLSTQVSLQGDGAAGGREGMGRGSDGGGSESGGVLGFGVHLRADPAGLGDAGGTDGYGDLQAGQVVPQVLWPWQRGAGVSGGWLCHHQPESLPAASATTPVAMLLRITPLLLLALGLWGEREKPKFCGEVTECFTFDLICNSSDYEARLYPPSAWVSTRVNNTYTAAKTIGFWHLFRYIQGRNQLGVKIPMTAPVLTRVDQAAGETQEYTISFLLPAGGRATPRSPPSLLFSSSGSLLCPPTFAPSGGGSRTPIEGPTSGPLTPPWGGTPGTSTAPGTTRLATTAP
ncbi:unnamed protein product [Natator depressus]